MADDNAGARGVSYKGEGDIFAIANHAEPGWLRSPPGAVGTG